MLRNSQLESDVCRMREAFNFMVSVGLPDEGNDACRLSRLGV